MNVRPSSRQRVSRKQVHSSVRLRELLLVGVLILMSVAYLFWSNRPTQFVRFDEAEFKVEVAESLTERQIGLSKHTSLQNDEGMLFIFEDSSEHGIWMKDMKFSIDIIWLDEDRRVVHLEKNVSPNTYPDTFRPNVAARYVLEIYSGQADAQGIGLGDQANFDL